MFCVRQLDDRNEYTCDCLSLVSVVTCTTKCAVMNGKFILSYSPSDISLSDSLLTSHCSA